MSEIHVLEILILSTHSQLEWHEFRLDSDMRRFLANVLGSLRRFDAVRHVPAFEIHASSELPNVSHRQDFYVMCREDV